MDKLRWGYMNMGSFNIKEAMELPTETHRMEKEAKLRKIWGGTHGPKWKTLSGSSSNDESLLGIIFRPGRSWVH